jgi:hypothetical protein
MRLPSGARSRTQSRPRCETRERRCLLVDFTFFSCGPSPPSSSSAGFVGLTMAAVSQRECAAKPPSRQNGPAGLAGRRCPIHTLLRRGLLPGEIGASCLAISARTRALCPTPQVALWQAGVRTGDQAAADTTVPQHDRANGGNAAAAWAGPPRENADTEPAATPLATSAARRIPVEARCEPRALECTNRTSQETEPDLHIDQRGLCWREPLRPGASCQAVSQHLGTIRAPSRASRTSGVTLGRTSYQRIR